MSIFSTLQSYAGKWAVKDSRKFTEEEINEVQNAAVVESNFGKSVCFFMKKGDQHYIPLGRNSEEKMGIGESVDLSKCEVVTLCKTGEADIIRVEIGE